jgi:hypothetical protein
MRRALLAGIACCALAGFSGPAFAKSPEFYVLTLRLPGGGVEHIRYTGDVPPTIVIAPEGASFAPMPALFGPNSPFAVMDRISAEMDQEAASLVRQVESMAAAPMPEPGSLTEAAFGRLPPGVSGYSFVSTMSGSGVCMESTRITYSGSGAPKIVSSRSGDCGPGAGGAVPASVHASPAPAPVQPPGTVIASSAGARRAANLVREADWQQ